MPTVWLVIALLALSGLGFVLGRNRALASAGGNAKALHSLPAYYGHNVAFSALVPALAVLAIWSLAQPMVIENRVSAMIPAELVPENSTLGLVMSDVRRLAEGLDLAVEQGVLSSTEARNLDSGETDIRARLGDIGVALGSEVRPEVLNAAQSYRSLSNKGQIIMSVIVGLLAMVGFAWAYGQIGRAHV